MGNIENMRVRVHKQAVGSLMVVDSMGQFSMDMVRKWLKSEKMNHRLHLEKQTKKSQRPSPSRFFPTLFNHLIISFKVH